ncbi:MAG: class I SAM-dependent methyltransferase [Bacteroidia bacterium]
MSTHTNYNSIARFYDVLSKLVFNSSIQKAQIGLLPLIPAKCKLLIVGGGTGWILEEITKLYPSNLEITYIDSSSKMIKYAKKRSYASNNIRFMEATIESISLQANSFDIIITSFFADGFSQLNWQQVFTKLDASLQPKGIWLYTDFQLNAQSPLWQRLLIKLLYLFFKITCRIQTQQLPAVEGCFSSYELISKRMYFSNFIIAQAFRK